MQIDQLKEGSTLTMKVSGRLDTMTAPQLESEITGHLDGITEFIMDFTDLEYISSAGLRVLLVTSKMMKGKGRFVIRNINETVREIFEVTGFSGALALFFRGVMAVYHSMDGHLVVKVLSDTKLPRTITITD